MFKKIAFALCLLFFPITMAGAYPNEPTGYALLYWCETINQVLSCHFDNDLGLNSITIPIPRESNQIASTFRNIVRNIAAVCGEPSYLNNGIALWRGDSIFLGVMVGPGVIMIDINRVKY